MNDRSFRRTEGYLEDNASSVDRSPARSNRAAPYSLRRASTLASLMAASAAFTGYASPSEAQDRPAAPQEASAESRENREMRFRGFANSWGFIDPNALTQIGSDVMRTDPAISNDLLDVARTIPQAVQRYRGAREGRATEPVSDQEMDIATEASSHLRRLNGEQVQTVMESASRLVRAGRVEPRDVRYLIRQVVNHSPDVYAGGRGHEVYGTVALRGVLSEGQLRMITAYLQERQRQAPPADAEDQADAIRASGEMTEDGFRSLFTELSENGRLDREALVAVFHSLPPENQQEELFDRLAASLEASIPLVWLHHCEELAHPSAPAHEEVVTPPPEAPAGYTVPTTAATSPTPGTRIDVSASNAGAHHRHHRR